MKAFRKRFQVPAKVLSGSVVAIFLLNYAKHDRILTGYIRILNGSCDDFIEIFFRIQVSRFFVDVSSVLLRNLMKVLENIDASLQQVYFKIVVRNNTECSPGS